MSYRGKTSHSSHFIRDWDQALYPGAGFWGLAGTQTLACRMVGEKPTTVPPVPNKL